MNIRKNEIKKISKQIEMYIKQEILLSSPKEKIKEIEDEMEADLLRFRYQTYQSNSSYKKKENDLIKRKRSRYYNARDIEFYLFFHVYLVEDHLRPSKVIAIPAKAVDCYNEMEY
jgi:hypothetical protein